MSTTHPTPAPDRSLIGLAEAVRHWARTTPDAPACTFVDYGRERDGVAETWTYSELHERASGAAVAALETGHPGDRVAILLPQSLEYTAALLGCLYAGLVAVPLYAPDLRRANDRVAGAVADSRPVATFVTSAAASDAGQSGLDAMACGRLLPVEDFRPVNGSSADFEPPVGDVVAYLQYTSGSTRRPAGVMVTGDNLAAGCAQLRNAFRVGGAGTVVSWLPFFHDMGLLMGIAAPLHAGAHVVTMSPFAFVQRPVRWLRLITEHRATTTASPNFGLDQAVHRVNDAERVDLDLRSLEALLNGAEPIRASTLDRFTEMHRPFGFRASAHRPGYGLAEATLTVTASRPTEEGPVVRAFDREALAVGKVVEAADHLDASVLVGCGTPEQQQIRVIDPRTHEAVAPDMVGEVWVSGPNVCAGYFGRIEDTDRTFKGRIAGEADPGNTEHTTQVDVSAGEASGVDGRVRARGWLRTGDLGFLHEGQLFIASRLKDLIIVNGQNHYPADIEVTVEHALSQARTGHVAAFPAEVEGQEVLVVVIEIEPRHARSFDAAAGIVSVRHALSHGHQVEAHDIVFARSGTIPKTTSGKLQRSECASRYLEDGLESYRI